MKINGIYYKQCMQYINAHGNHWILCPINPFSEGMHCTIYNSMTLPTEGCMKKLNRVLNIKGNVCYIYANVLQMPYHVTSL